MARARPEDVIWLTLRVRRSDVWGADLSQAGTPSSLPRAQTVPRVTTRGSDPPLDPSSRTAATRISTSLAGAAARDRVSKDGNTRPQAAPHVFEAGVTPSVCTTLGEGANSLRPPQADSGPSRERWSVESRRWIAHRDTPSGRGIAPLFCWGCRFALSAPPFGLRSSPSGKKGKTPKTHKRAKEAKGEKKHK